MHLTTAPWLRLSLVFGLLIAACDEAEGPPFDDSPDHWREGEPSLDVGVPPVGGANPAIPSEELVLWLDASRSGFPLVDGSAAEDWRDLANEDKLIEVPDGCSAPQWVEHVPGLNRRSAVHFDGVSTCLSIPDLYIHADTTVFIVASASPQTDAAWSWWRPLLASAGRTYKPTGNSYGIGLGRGGTSGLGVSLGCDPAANGGVDCQNPEPSMAHEQKVFAAGIQQDGRYDVLRVTRDRATDGGTTIHRGRQLMAAGTLRRSTGHGTGYTLGADPAAYGGNPARHYKGDIAEVLIYNRVLADTEVDEVNAYLERKYNLYQHQVPSRTRALWLNASDLRALHARGTGGESCREIDSPSSQIHNGDPLQQWDDSHVSDFACRAGGDSDTLGHDAIQNTPNLQPKWMKEQVNGFPAVVFDGADDLLGMNQLSLGPWASVFVVAQDAEQTTAGGSVWRPLLAHCGDPFRDNGRGYGLALQKRGRGGLAAVLGKSAGLDAVEVPWANEDGAFHLYSLEPGPEPNTMQLGVDAGLMSTGPRSRNSGLGTCYQLGAQTANSARRYSGAIAEVLIYDPPSEAERLSPDEVSRVRRYLTTKYALPGASAKRWQAYRSKIVQRLEPFPIGAWAFHRTVEKESGEDPYPAYAAAGLNFTQVPADEASFDHLSSATDNELRTAVGTWRHTVSRFFLHPPGHADYADPDGSGEGAPNMLAAARDGLGIEDADPTFYLLTDEPERKEFTPLGMAHQALFEVDGDSPAPVPLLTVVPITFGDSSRFKPGDREEYSSYIEDLIRETQTGILAPTTYELFGEGPKGAVEPKHYYMTLDVLREQTRRAGVGMLGFVLATGHEAFAKLAKDIEGDCRKVLNRRYDSPSPSQLRRLAFTPLAYGAKGLVYYLWDRKEDMKHPTCDAEEGSGRIWYQPGLAEDPELLAAATQINCEVQAFGPTLAGLDSTNVFHTGPDRPAETLAYAEVSNSFFPFFVDGDNLIVGEFRTRDALSETRYAMIVNRDDNILSTAHFLIPHGYTVTRLGATDDCEMSSEDEGASFGGTVELAPGESALLRFDRP